MCVCTGPALIDLLTSRGTYRDHSESKQRTVRAILIDYSNKITLTKPPSFSVAPRCISRHPDACDIRMMKSHFLNNNRSRSSRKIHDRTINTYKNIRVDQVPSSTRREHISSDPKYTNPSIFKKKRPTVHDDECFYCHSWRNHVVIAFETLPSFLT